MPRTPARRGHPAGYRAVLAVPGSRLWYAAAVCARAPVVMAPLALVFAGYAARSFALGGVLAAVYAFGEAAAAPALGRLFDTRPFVGQLRWTLGLNAVLFAILGLGVTHAPAAVLVALSAAAGASGSGAPGGMRAQLTAIVPENLRTAALSLDTVVAQAVRAVAPPLASGLYTLLSARGAVLGMAVLAAIPPLAAHRIPHQDPGADASAEAPDRDGRDGATGGTASADLRQSPVSIRQVLRLSWPTALISAAIMFLVGTVDVLLPARLKAIGSSPALAGPILMAFAITSILAGIIYGMRAWPGSARVQSLVMTLAMAAVLTVPGFTRLPWTYTMMFAIGGLCYAPLLTVRNVVLQEQLPQTAWATGFSILYAAAGVGYGVAGLLAAVLLDVAGTGPAFPACTAASALIAFAALVGERAMHSARHHARDVETATAARSE